MLAKEQHRPRGVSCHMGGLFSPTSHPPELSPVSVLWTSLPVCWGTGNRPGRREEMVPGDKVQPGRGQGGGECVGTDL
jgi:hypothetical protein